MDEILKQTLLYDFYGELLTAHQKEIYEQVVLEDYSLSEVAEAAGISRQGVHDLVKRCSKTLEGYESRLHLVERFMSVKQKVHEINTLLEDYGNQDTEELMARIRQLSSEIIEEL
ncbi:MAG TPA: DNA-binding protein [Candidatus Bariatricus faecipullorum]|nr:DNA-binding protein [Candidatus Bariatricus faecipullorum]